MKDSGKQGVTSGARPLRVLIVEDVPADAELTIATLKRAGYTLTFEIVDSLEQFKERIDHASFDLIFSDHNLRTWNGVDGLEYLRKEGKEIPFIVISGTLGDEAAVEYIKQGAADYVLKHRLERLPAVVGRALREKANREETERLHDQVYASKVEWEMTFDQVPDGVFLLDSDGRVQRANRAAVVMLGIDFNKLIGQPYDKIIFSVEEPGTETPHLLGVLEKSEGSRIDIEVRRLEKVFEVALSPLRDSSGGLRGAVVVMRDVTERRRAEDNLRQSEEQFRLISENIADLIAVLDLQGRRVYNSPSYKEILGAPEALSGTDSFNEIHPEDREKIKRIFEETIRTGLGQRAEYRFLMKDGSIRNVESQGSVIRDAEGKPVKVVVVSRDITERKKLEDQLRHSQKMEAVGQLAGGVAHDFNNLLTVINGYSELTLQQSKPDDAVQKYVAEIKKAGDRAASLTRQLLAFSRRQVLEPQILDLNSVIANMQAMLRRLIGEDIDLVTIQKEGLGRAKADPGQVEQILLNLAVNARDAMPQGGKLSIETANVDLDESYARNHITVKPGPYVMLAVSDTGIGMDAEIKKRIFEPFFTTKEPGKGTGLGLSTVYGIVRQSEGNIWVYSEPGRGTTFKVYLPRVDQPTDSVGSTKTETARPRGTETILLVEDDDSVRPLVRATLELNGYHVLETTNGADALSTSKGHSGNIDLLLTDLVMPGISGRVLAEQIVPLRPELRVLFMSGYTDDAVVRHGGLQAGMAFIQKPFTPDGLARKVREVLDSGQGR